MGKEMTRVDAHCYNSFVIHGDPSGCMMCKFELDYYIYYYIFTSRYHIPDEP